MGLRRFGTVATIVVSLLVSSSRPVAAEGKTDAAALDDWIVNVRDKLTGKAQVEAILEKAKEMTGRPVVKPRFQLEDDRIVGCTANNLPSLELVKGLPLRSIHGVPLKTSNLDLLKGLPLARVVIKWSRSLRRIDGLRGAPIEYLDLHGSKYLGDKSGLRGMPLRHLNLREAGPIPDLEVLQGMPLTSLDISHHSRIERPRSNVVDLGPLADLKLTELWIDNTHVSDLRPLRKMPLEMLSIVRAHVTDLSPIKDRPLKHLDLRETGVVDLSPLAEMELETLSFTAGRILEGMDVIRQMTTLKKINGKSPQAFWATAAQPKKEMRSPETQNMGIAIVPAPGEVAIDGELGDWDLSGGIFACSDLKEYRGQASLWIHVMYDATNLYVLARWADASPMSNPSEHGVGYAWDGDSIQWRMMTKPGDVEQQRIAHVTAWRDGDGKEILDIEYGNLLTGVGREDRKLNPPGARQAFRKNADGKGYVQEMCVPWSLLTKEGYTPAAGDRVEITVQAHFLIPGETNAPKESEFTERPTKAVVVRDLSKATEHGVERSHLFWYPHLWAAAQLEPKGNVEPRPVRVRGGREFKVTVVDGRATVDWEELAAPK